MAESKLEETFIVALMVLGRPPDHDSPPWPTINNYIAYLAWLGKAEDHYLEHVVKTCGYNIGCDEWVMAYRKWTKTQPPQVDDFYHRPPLHACKGE